MRTAPRWRWSGFAPAGTTSEPMIIFRNNVGRCYDFLTADEPGCSPPDKGAAILPPDEKAPF